MKQYKELDLKKIREECDIDFAHFTFRGNMCSCCYGPRDLPSKYWRNHIIPDADTNYEFILFKNANNGSGTVTKNDYITDDTCILWDLSSEKLSRVCEMLQSQLGEEYVVIKPENSWTCITIRLKEKLNILN